MHPSANAERKCHVLRVWQLHAQEQHEARDQQQPTQLLTSSAGTLPQPSPSSRSQPATNHAAAAKAPKRTKGSAPPKAKRQKHEAPAERPITADRHTIHNLPLPDGIEMGDTPESATFSLLDDIARDLEVITLLHCP